ncbi:hypothetical protein V8E54_004387 [Elaphomyces granulatus]
MSQIAEGVEALNAEAKRLPSRVTGRHAANPAINRQQPAASTNEPGEAMELDTMRLSAAEQAHRFQNNLCLYCGKPDHRKFNCPAAKARLPQRQLRLRACGNGIHQGLQSAHLHQLIIYGNPNSLIKRKKLGLNVRVAKYQKEALRMHLTSIDSSLLRRIHLIWREFLEVREEHEEEEVANAGPPSENVSQPTRQAKPTPEPHRKKRKKYIGDREDKDSRVAILLRASRHLTLLSLLISRPKPHQNGVGGK